MMDFTMIRMVMDVFLDEYIHMYTSVIDLDNINRKGYSEIAHLNNEVSIDKWSVDRKIFKTTYSKNGVEIVNNEHGRFVTVNRTFNYKNVLIKCVYACANFNKCKMLIYRDGEGRIEKIYICKMVNGCGEAKDTIDLHFEYEDSKMVSINVCFGDYSKIFSVDYNQEFTVISNKDQFISLRHTPISIEGRLEMGRELTMFEYIYKGKLNPLLEIKRRLLIRKYNRHWKFIDG